MKTERKILHIDCNKFYASVECLHNPEIRNKPVAVGGSEEARHGIILTKNEIASRYGIKTAEPIWKAKIKCPELIVVPPNFPLYVRFSEMAKNIYKDYSDYIEPFGLDENWVDVTGSTKPAEEIAYEIKERVKFELGITVSIGVSWNKVFAKFGSDYRKPDAVTVITKENFRDIVWKSPASDMLFVGSATSKKLSSYGIYTIGDLALADLKFLCSVFGRNGELLHNFANGFDATPVRHMDDKRTVKSVGNSTTTPRDMVNNEDVKTVFTVLAESVAMRMRKDGLKAVTISVRDKNLNQFTRQGHTKAHTDVSTELLETAMKIFLRNYNWENPIRSLGLSVSEFDFEESVQFDLSGTVEKREKMQNLERAVDNIRERFGVYSVQRASMLKNSQLGQYNTHENHSMFPVDFHNYN